MQMFKDIGNRVPFKNLSDDSKLRLLHDCLPWLGITELPDGSRLVVRDGREILIPKPAKEELTTLMVLQIQY